jgi:hypothetical protein
VEKLGTVCGRIARIAQTRNESKLLQNLADEEIEMETRFQGCG